jgi:hypothetical protein
MLGFFSAAKSSQQILEPSQTVFVCGERLKKNKLRNDKLKLQL